MGTAIGDMLPLAATIALFPISILAVILMLFSPRPRKRTAYTAGWVVGLTAIVTIAALLTTGVDEIADGDDHHGSSDPFGRASVRRR